MNDTNGDGANDDKDELEFLRGDLNGDDLADLEAAIDEIDFAARQTTPELLGRVKALAARLDDIVEQYVKGVRRPSTAKKPLTPEEEQRYERMVQEGVAAAAEQGDLEKARACLEAAVRVDPDEPSGLFNLGVLYGRLAEVPKGGIYSAATPVDEYYAEKAALCYERVLELDPDNAAAMTNLAAIYDVHGETDAAKELLRRALEIDPNEKKAREHLAELEESGSKP